MSYKSKYFNLNSIRDGWTKKEFCYVIEILESLPRKLLFDLLDKFKICFQIEKENEKFLEDEELISVLLSDVPKKDIIDAVKRIIKKPPLKYKSFSLKKI